MTNQRRLLRKLGRLWEKHPELRLGQLVDNLAWKAGQAGTFNVSDKEFEEGMNAVLADGFGKSDTVLEEKLTRFVQRTRKFFDANPMLIREEEV